MEKNTSNLKDLIGKIEKKDILLPDFQRGFVWKDEEQQRKIVASVLAKMPIGSILLLKSQAGDYSSKQIGSKNSFEPEDTKQVVEFLLDGQQRMTVLTNVFSNVIHEQCEKVSDLISPTLKRRFFLRIPKWKDCDKENDIFGVKKFEFSYKNPDSEYPKFLSGDVLNNVECLNFLNNDKKPYNPQSDFSTELDDFCRTYEKGYLIPLYLVVPSRNRNGDKMKLRMEVIQDEIARNIEKEIKTEFQNCDTDEERSVFIEKFIEDKRVCKEILDGNTGRLDEYLEEKKYSWKADLSEYLDSCVKAIALSKIEVESEQRERAIDIYENLNRGGVSLSTFDLIMARVAKVNRNWYRQFTECLKEKQEYTLEVVPKDLKALVSEQITDNNYNAIIQTKSLNEDKNEIASKFIDAFLDVLSLYCSNKEYDPQKYSIDDIKRKKILNLQPEEINDNTKMVCNALSRALFFFQTRCGIRNVNEINYSLMLVLVGVVFTKKEWFEQSKVHDLLEALYWSDIFSGEFDKDQNVTMIAQLQKIIKAINGDADLSWLVSLENEVLNGQNFSDKEFLLMEKAKEDRCPKLILRSFLCQYLLAKTYTDMFEDKKISVFYEDADSLEEHHIVPLGSVKKVGESTAKLRSMTDNICNSPLNFVYITKEANKAISSKELDSYIKGILPKAKSALHISNIVVADDNKVKEILADRFVNLQGDIMQHISNLRDSWKMQE